MGEVLLEKSREGEGGKRRWRFVERKDRRVDCERERAIDDDFASEGGKILLRQQDETEGRRIF